MAGDRRASTRCARSSPSTRDGRFTSFAVVQSAPADHPTAAPAPAGVGLYSHAARLAWCATSASSSTSTASAPTVPELVGVAQPDLVLVNDDDLTYAKIRLDERSLGHARRRASASFADRLPRTLCWSAAWDMTRDAELSARDFVALVRSGHRHARPTSASLQGLLRQARRRCTCSRQWPSARGGAGGTRRLPRSSWRVGAEPGSDHQLAFVRSFASLARTDEQLDLVRAACSTAASPFAGLTVDTDLRWALLQRLVAIGRADDEAIDAELERDRDRHGRRRQAAAARARCPPRGEGGGLAGRRRQQTSCPMRCSTPRWPASTHPDHSELNAGVRRPLLRHGRGRLAHPHQRDRRRRWSMGSSPRSWSSRRPSTAPRRTWQRTTRLRRCVGCCSRRRRHRRRCGSKPRADPPSWHPEALRARSHARALDGLGHPGDTRRAARGRRSGGCAADGRAR